MNEIEELPDADYLYETMEKDVKSHEDSEHWTLTIKEVISSKFKIIHVLWSFKRKRYPEWNITKYKFPHSTQI